MLRSGSAVGGAIRLPTVTDPRLWSLCVQGRAAMQCPSCGFDNPEGMKFCGECGTGLKNLSGYNGFC
jgi:hypothetical protein